MFSHGHPDERAGILVLEALDEDVQAEEAFPGLLSRVQLDEQEVAGRIHDAHSVYPAELIGQIRLLAF